MLYISLAMYISLDMLFHELEEEDDKPTSIVLCSHLCKSSLDGILKNIGEKCSEKLEDDERRRRHRREKRPVGCGGFLAPPAAGASRCERSTDLWGPAPAAGLWRPPRSRIRPAAAAVHGRSANCLGAAHVQMATVCVP